VHDTGIKHGVDCRLSYVVSTEDGGGAVCDRV